MPSSNTYLYDAIERLCQGLVTITDSDGNKIVTSAQTYMLPYPSGSNWAAANPFRLSRQEQPQGSPVVSQVWDIPVRIGIGNLNQELGGNQQAKLWERIPTIVNWITEHPHLQFTTGDKGDPDYLKTTVQLTYLDTTTGVKVAPGALSARAEAQETGKILWFDITVQIPFRVQMNIIKYQDGQIIEV